MNTKIGKSEALYEVRQINNLKELVYGSAKLYKDNVAFRYKESDENATFTYKDSEKFVDITYAQLEHDITCLGTAFFSLGLHNKRIAVIGPNSYWWAVSYFATVCGTRSCCSN